MDKTKVLERTSKDLRSVLISAPRGVPLRLLLSDFKMVLGSELPYRQLGFQRLEDFLRSIPNVVRIDRGATGETTCFAVADASTSQIARFVATQKKPKLKKSNAPPLIRKPVYSGFTKKSKFGPSSARPRPKSSPYFSRGGGGKFMMGPGNVYTGGGGASRQYARQPYGYSKGPRPPLRPQQQNQLPPPPPPSARPPPAYRPAGYNVSYRPAGYNGTYRPAGYNVTFFGGNNSGGFTRQPPLTNGSASQGHGYVGGGGSAGQGHGYVGGGGSAGQGHGYVSGGGLAGHQSSRFGSDWNSGLPRSSSGQAPVSSPSTSSSVKGSSSYADRIGSAAIRGSSSPNPPTRTGIFSSKLADSRGPPNCPSTTIKELGDWCTDLKGPDIRGFVSVEGFIARDGAYDIPNQTFKYLLYSGFDRAKKGILPAVMLFFKKEAWDIEDKTQDFQSFPIGSRVRVYGQPLRQKNKSKMIFEPALKIHHYQYETGPSSGAPKWSPIRHNSSSSSSPPSGTTGDSRGVAPPNLDRLIYDLLKSKPNGVWGKRLGAELKSAHGFDFPGDILSRARSLPFVISDDMGDRSNPNYILTLAMDATEVPAPLPKEPASRQVADKSASSSAGRPAVSFTTEKPALPGTVEFTSADYFDVYVTDIDNPISFYLHRIGEDYSAKLQSMTEAMSNRLSQSSTKPVAAVKEDELYAYPWDGGDMWCRVLTNKVSGKMADIYFPDYGNSEQVRVADLVDLPREFYQLPFQAVHCCLHGCTGVSEEATELFIKLALEKTCVAQVMDSSGTRVAVELIDSESESGDTTINSVIASAIHPVSTLVPKLPNPGDPRVPVILTDIDEDGVVTVQLRGHGVNRLQQLMEVMNEKYKKAHAADFVKTVTEGKVYCTQFSADKKYYRVKVKKGIPKKLLVEYVDYGNEEETEIQKLRRPLGDPLFDLPPQAVKCKLYGLPKLDAESWSENVTYFVATYLDCEDLYLTTVESGCGQDVLPLVRLVVSPSEEEEGEEREDVLLNDLIMQQDFEINVQSNPDSDEDAPVATETGGNGDRTLNSPQRGSTTEVSPPPGFNSIQKFSTPSEPKRNPSHINAFENSGSNAAEIDQKPGTPSSKSFSLSPSKLLTPSSQSSQPFTPSPSPSKPLTPSSSVPATPSSLMSPVSAIPTQISSGIVPLGSVSVPTTPLDSLRSFGAENGPWTPLTSPPSSTSFFSPQSRGSAGVLSSPPGLVTTNGHTKGVLDLEVDRASLTSDPQAVEVVWVESPHNFMVQLVSDGDALFEMMEELNRAVPNFSALPFQDLRLGVVCCAPSSLDSRWYRVSVVAATDVASVTVKFLDYGSTEIVDVSLLKSLPVKFLDLRIQSISCTLRALQPLDSLEWSKQANSWFENRVVEKIFFAVEMGKDAHGRSYTTLLDTSLDNTVDIRDALKDAGFASFQVQKEK